MPLLRVPLMFGVLSILCTQGVTKEFDRTRDKLLETEVTAELLEYMKARTMAVQLWGHNINLQMEPTRASPTSTHGAVSTLASAPSGG